MGLATSSSLNTVKEDLDKLNRELYIQRQINQEGNEDIRLDEVDFDLLETDSKNLKIDPRKYDFCFENLVFEGGGMKGAAYVGAIRYMEELGLDKQFRRYAGTSAGAMLVAYLAMGYRSNELREFLKPKYISGLLNDNPWGILSLVPNVIRKYGWKPTSKLYNAMGDHFEAKSGDPDITFKSLYKRTGIELCICVTNVNHMNVTYCHVKTTPNMAIRQAVCMSMSIPGYFQAVKLNNMGGGTDIYVDGGLLCNYPIHCYDGWFLSMAPEDSFFDRFQPLSNISHLFDKAARFGTVNGKTIGFQLYSEYEQDLMKGRLDCRGGALLPMKPEPETKLYKKLRVKQLKKKKAEKIHAKVVRSVNAFLKAIKKYNIDAKDNVDLKELKLVFEDKETFTDYDCEVLFGKIITAEEAFEIIDKNKDGQIEFDELMEFIQKTGLCLQSCFQGYSRQEISGFTTFLHLVQSALLLNIKRATMDAKDIDRTVGINTGHVETIDFTTMVKADSEFLEERGYNSMQAFLRYHVSAKNLQPRSTDGGPSTTQNVENQPAAGIDQSSTRTGSQTAQNFGKKPTPENIQSSNRPGPPTTQNFGKQPTTENIQKSTRPESPTTQNFGKQPTTENIQSSTRPESPTTQNLGKQPTTENIQSSTRPGPPTTQNLGKQPTTENLQSSTRPVTPTTQNLGKQPTTATNQNNARSVSPTTQNLGKQPTTATNQNNARSVSPTTQNLGKQPTTATNQNNARSVTPTTQNLGKQPTTATNQNNARSVSPTKQNLEKQPTTAINQNNARSVSPTKQNLGQQSPNAIRRSSNLLGPSAPNAIRRSSNRSGLSTTQTLVSQRTDEIRRSVNLSLTSTTQNVIGQLTKDTKHTDKYFGPPSAEILDE